MKTIYAKDHGIVPGKEVAMQLNSLLKDLSSDKEDKTLVLEKGEYFLDSQNVPKPELYITNTIGDDEWKEGEKPHINAVGLYFKGIEKLTVEGNGATFTARGQMTNAAFEDCEELTFRNVEFKAENPDMHRFKVVNKGLGYIDFRLDGESSYVCEKGKYSFVGKDYKTPFSAALFTAFWIGKIPAKNDCELFRTSHPLKGAFSVKEISDHVFRARYFLPLSCKTGDEFYLFDVRRKYQGIFASKCKNLVVDGVKQRFNYGLANVFQDCENLSLINSEFAPAEGSEKKMASVADFIQVCCCRGTARIRDNFFCGAGDDCLNVHGIHFSAKYINPYKVNAFFRHKQSHGFCPFRKGDEVRFINPRTLLPCGENIVENAVLKDEYTIELTFREKVPENVNGLAIENATACPDVEFCNNRLDRIITRGLLLTTAGKVFVEDNCFMNTSMNAILVSDDAKSWYESGFVRDMTIRNNKFLGNKEYYVCVKPENSVHAGYVHSGITVERNEFASERAKGLYFKSAEKCKVIDNAFSYGKKIKTINSDIKTDM